MRELTILSATCSVRYGDRVPRVAVVLFGAVRAPLERRVVVDGRRTVAS